MDSVGPMSREHCHLGWLVFKKKKKYKAPGANELELGIEAKKKVG